MVQFGLRNVSSEKQNECSIFGYAVDFLFVCLFVCELKCSLNILEPSFFFQNLIIADL